MRRAVPLVGLVLALAILGTGVLSFAGAGRLTSGAAAQEPLLDLAWLAPGPTGFDVDGYGLINGTYRTAPSRGGSIRGEPGAGGSYTEAFRSAGPRQIYYQSLGLPSEDDPDVAARIVRVVLAEYGDIDVAKTAFAAIAPLFGEYEQIPTPPAVGDEALAFRNELTSDQGLPLEQLRILVRTDRFLTDLSLLDSTGDAPAVSEFTPFAQRVVERLGNAATAEGPGLGLQLVRLAGEDVATVMDFYTRRDGNQVPVADQSPSARQSDDDFFRQIGVTDRYFYVAEDQVTDDDPTYVGLIVDLRHFTDEETAATYLTTAAERWIASLSADYHNAEVVDDAETMGDGSVIVAFEQDTRTGKATGYRTWVQAGDRVAAIELDGVPAISLQTAQQWAQAQLACLEDGACTEPVTVTELTQGAPGARQEATPESGALGTPSSDSSEAG